MSLLKEIFYLGGIPGVLDDLWYLDLDTNIWTYVYKTQPWPEARFGHATVAINDSMYLFGGYNGVTLFQDCWRLDLLLKTWSLLTCANPPSNRTEVSMTAMSKTEILLFGGDDYHDKVFDDTYIWDVIQGNWTKFVMLT